MLDSSVSIEHRQLQLHRQCLIQNSTVCSKLQFQAGRPDSRHRTRPREFYEPLRFLYPIQTANSNKIHNRRDGCAAASNHRNTLALLLRLRDRLNRLRFEELFLFHHQ